MVEAEDELMRIKVKMQNLMDQRKSNQEVELKQDELITQKTYMLEDLKEELLKYKDEPPHIEQNKMYDKCFKAQQDVLQLHK